MRWVKISVCDIKNDLRRKWELLHERPELRESLRPEIKNSWERSYQYGIQYSMNTNPYVLSKSDFSLALEKSQNLINVSIPVLKGFIKYVSGSSITAVLADENFCLLKIFGDHNGMKWIEKARVYEGSLWSERLVGTNAGPLMSILQKPVMVIGYEHFCLFAHSGSCSCAPIMDQGKIIGNVAIMGPYNQTYGPTLGMAVSTTKLIETKLLLEKATKLPKALIESMPEGVLIIDEGGVINYANGNSARVLQRSGQSLVGLKVSDLLQEDPDNKHLISIINSRKSIKEEPIILKTGKKKIPYNISCTPLSNLDTSQTGMVVHLWENTKTNHLVINTISRRPKMTFDDIVGKNTRFVQSLYIAKAAASSSSNILILGESGTGKDIIAQSIHNASPRRNKPFLAINCAALPRELIASELFGYEEGAFTGAKKGGQVGKFELADQGTIFLDEIGDMPIDLQSTLLRVIEEKSLMRLGGSKILPVNVRIIAATNKNLEKEIELNRFRRDLYYRLGVIKMTIPALRERPEDIILLAQHFLEIICQRLDKPTMVLAPDVINAFMRYDWLGNVREMQNVLEGAINLASGNTITYDLIKEYLNPVESPALKNNEDDITISFVERQMILNYLEKNQYNKEKTAKALGMSRRTLYRRLKKYNLI